MDHLISSLEGFSFAEEMKTLETTLLHYIPFLKSGDITQRMELFITNQITNIFDTISEVLSSVFSIIAGLVIVPFITFFILKDYRRIMQGLLQTIPNKYFEMSYYILKKSFVTTWFVCSSLDF